MTRIAGTLVLLVLLTPGLAWSQSVECLNGFNAPNPGRGYTADGRRILTVHIGSSWDVAPGQTDGKIWNAVNNAVWELNNYTDPNGHKMDYYLVVDQTHSNGYPADFTVVKDSCSNSELGCATTSFPGTIRFEQVVGESHFDEHSTKILAGHELGHSLGLTRGVDGQSIMSRFVKWTDWSSGTPVDKYYSQVNGVKPNDIAAINQALHSPQTCTGTTTSTSVEIIDEGFDGSDEGEEEEYSGGDPDYECYDTWAVTYYFWRDSNGYWHFDYMTWDYLIGTTCYPLET